MGLFRLDVLSVCLLSLGVVVGHARAEDVVLKTDQTSLMMLTADPGTVVIGNPGIADVTLNGKQLFLHGKAPGSTNVTILDANGNKIADMDLLVSNDYRNQISVFSGSAKGTTTRNTFTCTPTCEPAMVAGDTADFLTGTIAGNTQRTAFATGGKTTSDAPPPKTAQ
jgi:hypothetical protein